MRIFYFIITSSLMIILMLLIRSIFRKRLSSNVIFTLWIILYFRLAVPFGYWEIPVFGTVAEIIYRPMAVAEQLFDKTQTDSIPINEEPLMNDVPIKEIQSEPESVKVYDAVIPDNTVMTQKFDIAENTPSKETNEEKHFTLRSIVLSIWFSGSLIAAGYVILQNHKLRKKVDEMDVVEQIDGIDVCISKELKTPCLFGVRNPKILLTEEVLNDATLYKYAIMHELEHYKHSDHIWNGERIFICIFYWWNPLIWYASKCVAEDAELACDERVLKNKSVEERKNYGYALLQMIENAQNKPLCLATSFSGNKNAAKQRIEAITGKTKTRKYILVPVVMILIIFTIVGCVYPSEKSYIKTNEWKTGETEELNYHEAKYEYSLQNEFQSMLFYYESYEYGELTERSILSYGDLEKYNDTLLLRHESYKYDEKDHLVFEMNGIGISTPIPHDTNKGYAMNSLYCDKELIEIHPGDDLILTTGYPTADPTFLNTYTCEILSTYDESELKELLSQNKNIFFVRLILSDLPAETLCEQMQKKELPEMLSIDEYNDKYSKSEASDTEMLFYTEPVENKVCLAVMPDGISKAGGDYRYIIPEDHVKWTDHYKQARSLAVDGAWKEGERSAGIWLVFNDEWTCITEQGMIFDFAKRVERKQIEDFYNLCMEEAIKYGTGTPVNPEDFPEIVSATLNYDGAYTVTDENILKDLRKLIFTSEELRGGSACPFTAALVLERRDKGYETIYLATDSCTTWLSDGVYYEYFGYNDFEEIYDIFKRYGAKIDSDELILKTENTFSYGIEIIKQTEERLREGYKEAKLTYVDNAEVGWDFYTDDPWSSDEERDAIAQAALKELYTLTGFNVEECTYTTDGRSRFIFGKSASNIKRCIAFYSRDYGFTLYGDSIPYMGFVNARKFHYSDVQQLDSPYGKKEYSGQGAIPMWFLEHSGVYQGEKITGFDAFNLDDTVFTHIKLFFDGGYYVVVMDEKIESFHEAMGPYYE